MGVVGQVFNLSSQDGILSYRRTIVSLAGSPVLIETEVLRVKADLSRQLDSHNRC